jgi:hypothetical protein
MQPGLEVRMNFRPLAVRSLGVGILAVLCFIIAVPSAVQAIPKITVTVEDAVGNPGTHNSVITVYMTNTFDTVAAFELWLQLSRPDIMKFQTSSATVIDTTWWECSQWNGSICIDSISCDPDTAVCPYRRIDTVDAYIGAIDTVGTLVRRWDKIVTRSISGNGLDIKITGLANTDFTTPPGHYKGIPPQGGGVLFRLLADISPISDTVVDRTAEIRISPFLDNFNFSRPNGSSIGIISLEVPDSNFFHCEEWVPPDSLICLSWQRVSGPPWDSVAVGVDTTAIMDTTAIRLYNGMVTVIAPPPGACCLPDSTCVMATGEDGCELLLEGTYKGNGVPCGDSTFCLSCCIGPTTGNLDMSPDMLVTMGDLTVLIDHLFITLTPLACPDAGNMDLSSDGLVTMGDLTVLIDHLFITLTPLSPCP